VLAHINGIQMAYSDTGSGSPAVLLVHGFPLNRSMWDPQVGRLRAAGYRVIVPDLRGFGASEGDAGGSLTMDQHADDLRGLLDALRIEAPVVFVGLSMGGYVGFALWRRQPSRIGGFVLADTRAAADTPAGLADRQKMIERAEAENSSQVAIDIMRPRLFSPTLRAGAPVERQVLAMMSSNSAACVANGARGLAVRADSAATLPTISVPTLVMVGEHDLLTPPADSQLLAQQIPNAKLVRIDQAGHMSNMENPDAFNDALLAFISDATGGHRVR
jgi:pimeloyl-ACP methyl ester carboxylesterase